MISGCSYSKIHENRSMNLKSGFSQLNATQLYSPGLGKLSKSISDLTGICSRYLHVNEKLETWYSTVYVNEKLDTGSTMGGWALLVLLTSLLQRELIMHKFSSSKYY